MLRFRWTNTGGDAHLSDELEAREQFYRWKYRDRRLRTIATTVRAAILGGSVVAVAYELSRFAGKSTNVGLAVTISVSISLVGVAAVVAALYRVRDQRKELLRLRQEKAELEAEIRRLEGGG